MKPIFLLIATLLVTPTLAHAQQGQTLQEQMSAMQPATVVPSLPPITGNAPLDEAIRKLQNDWAMIKYQEPSEDTQLTRMKALAKMAAKVEANYPDYVEPKIWHAIILSTVAGIDGGLGALDYAEEAKGLLEQAIKNNPNALDGSAYTSLGTLYYKAPAWPIAFGDNGKARAYLEQARAISPDGIDANFFYGDFLIGTGHAKEAIPVLTHALEASARPGREIADAGRREEIKEALAKAHQETKE